MCFVITSSLFPLSFLLGLLSLLFIQTHIVIWILSLLTIFSLSQTRYVLPGCYL
ncbi:hypothetical protein SCHPADRAFT_572684 [Schizopora paradoxa]|uniref:Uncharacterized protein n=1 Tax=Schizopora paradoxa TaxID=27342 RepID=A0A0H2RWV0_9AGAM|nr:hypothetical protein SCHPADRAFT_572684 [Schizopora paradoxa]